MSITIGVKLDEEIRDRLKSLGTARQRSTHWLMREAIREYLERERKPWKHETAKPMRLGRTISVAENL